MRIGILIGTTGLGGSGLFPPAGFDFVIHNGQPVTHEGEPVIVKVS